MKIKFIIIATIITITTMVVPFNTSSATENVPPEVPKILTTNSHGQGGW